MQTVMMQSAQPPNFQGFIVSIVMSVNFLSPTDFACLFFQITRLHRPLHGKMSIIFGRVSSAPVRLTGIGFQHLKVPK